MTLSADVIIKLTAMPALPNVQVLKSTRKGLVKNPDRHWPFITIPIAVIAIL